MTPAQALYLPVVDRINREHFNGWFKRSWVFAFIQVESGFRAQATRYEPGLNEASYGPMQVLASTAARLGFNNEPAMMMQPEFGCLVGMTVAKRYWDMLTETLGRSPTLEEWCATYNEGVGDTVHQRPAPDRAYVVAWMHAQQYWAAEIDTGATMGSPSPQ